MCGIAGIYSKQRPSVATVSQMLTSIAYRGPDHSGATAFAGKRGDHLAVGQARLAILDPSPEAHQPFANDAGTQVLTFNGEFYNFKSIRQALSRQGYTFRTRSDVEVALKLFETKGADALTDLWGMFAGAYFDQEKSELLLFRDRLGKKPLYYIIDGNRLIFASEPKAILKALDHIPQIDPDALLAYFILGYIPDNLSIYRDIKQVPPGHQLRVGPDLIPTCRRWYHSDTTSVAAHDAFEDLFLSAVELRMISDRPLGAFLSGGLDSSLVVAAMSRLSSKPVNTFCVRFDGPQLFDESPYARRVAAHCRTDHHEVSLGVDSLLTAVEDILDHMDEPFGDSSAIPMFVVSREARRHFTVALSGDGADETYAGYRKYLGEVYVRRLGPYWMRRALLKPLLRLWPTGRTSAVLEWGRRARRLLQGDAKKPELRHVNWLQAGPVPSFELMGDAFSKAQYDHIISGLVRRLPKNPSLTDRLQFDQELVLVHDMFVKVDRMSMKASLEVRCPFVDHRLVAFANRLPDDQKLRGTKRKAFLVDRLGHHLPPEVLLRPKAGFELPLGVWLRRDLKAWAEDRLFHHSRNGDWVDLGALRHVWRQHLSGRLDCTETLWFHVVFSSWLKRYQDGAHG